jgi:hypothetical protein
LVFNAIEIDVFIQKGNVRLLLQTITRARSLFSRTTEGRADLSLKNLKYLLTSLSLEEIALRERERERSSRERKKEERDAFGDDLRARVKERCKKGTQAGGRRFFKTRLSLSVRG